MKSNRLCVLAAMALMLAVAMNAQAAPQTTAFTYQGQLNSGGSLPSGQTYHFIFTLYDDPTTGSPIGPSIPQSIVVGSGGLFTTDLDFGQVFNGQQYYLEIKVGTAAGNEQPLSARQLISVAPVAQYALNSPTRFVFLSSASQAIVTTNLTGFSDMVAVLPLSGAVSSAYSTTTSAGIINLAPNGSTPPQPPQILPVSGQFGSISAQMFLNNAVSLLGTTVFVQAQLYTGNMSSGIMVPTGLTCVLSPPLTGIASVGTSAGCLTTGAAIPVVAGSSAVVVISATAIGAAAFNLIPMTVSVGVGP